MTQKTKRKNKKKFQTRSQKLNLNDSSVFISIAIATPQTIFSVVQPHGDFAAHVARCLLLMDWPKKFNQNLGVKTLPS